MSIAILNGFSFDGSTTFATFGVLTLPLTAGSYGDELETDTIGETGSQLSQYITPGRIKNKPPTFTFREDVFLASFQPALATFGFGNTMLNITVAYVAPDGGSETDLIMNCRYVDAEQKWSNDVKASVVETKWVCSGVLWTNARKMRAAPVGAGDSGDSGFTTPTSIFNVNF